MKKYPLLPSQSGVFIENIKYPESTQYNLPLFFELPSDVDEERLISAWQTLFEKKAVFKLRFCQDESGTPYQWYDKNLTPCVQICNCTEQELVSKVESAVSPFDLVSGEPLVRVILFITEDRKYLFTDIHHIIMDGAGFTVLFRQELKKAYAGENVEDDRVMLQEAENAAALSGTAEYEAAGNYFRKKFAGVEFLTFGSGDPVPGRIITACSYVEKEACDAWCEQNGISPAVLFQAAFHYCIGIFSGQKTIAYGMAYHNRSNENRKRSLGMYAGVVPVLAELPGAISLKEYFALVRAEQKEAIAHAVFPVSDFFREFKKIPKIHFCFNAGRNVNIALQLEKNSSPMVFLDRPVIQSDITVYVLNSDKGYKIQIDASDKMYKPEFLDKLAKALSECVKNMMADPERKLREISVLSEAEKEDLIKLGTGETIPYDRNTTFVDLFKLRVQAAPDAKAVVAVNGTLTYGDLDAQSSALAAALVVSGVNPGDFVAVKLSRVKEFPLAVIAVWKAGAVYVPVDPEYPEERIAYMLEDSGAKVIIDEAFIQKETGKSSGSLNLARPSGLAYMIYTSGSTGKPKGVMVSHANLRTFLAWLPDELGLKAGEAVAEHASFSFDASICDLYTSLSAGATLHILSSELRKDLDGLAKYLTDNKIAGATFSTQLGVELLNACDLNLRYMVLGGEKLKHVKKTSVRLYNGYGPTEFTCWSSHHVVDQVNDSEDIPIGRAVPNSLSAIVDAAGNLLPRGLVGELVLAGNQLSQGYWNRTELTAERFVYLPWLAQRVYRTGDLARWNEDGELLYCGRIDSQVKLRGFRIEMGEIEAAMAKFPGIVSAVAEVKNINGTQHLCAYYVSDSKTDKAAAETDEAASETDRAIAETDRATAEIDEAALRSALAETLAGYMVPDIFVRLEKLPLTPNGKVDRKALPVPELHGAAYAAPENETEAAVAWAMADVLNLSSPVGRDDDFISLGGDSIKSIRLVSRLRTAGVTVTVADIMKEKTVSGIAAAAASAGSVTAFAADQSDWSGEVPLTAVQTLFFRDWKLEKPEHFNQSMMLTASERIDAGMLKTALDTLARHHDMLRAVYTDNVQRVRAAEGEGSLCELAVVESEDSSVIPRNAEAVQASFDLANGPLFKAMLFKGKEADHVLLVIHHFIIDGVSWRILLEDLETAYGQLRDGVRVSLPAKTAPMRDWSAAVRRYAGSSALRRELGYWRDIDLKIAAMPHTAARSAETRELARTLGAGTFAALTGRASAAYHTEINDLLLTALGRAYAAVTGSRVLSVELEGHGREPLNEETQIDRTVGWFTSVYPVIIETGEDLRTSIRGVKETLRRIPNHGLGYGILRYLAKEPDQSTEALQNKGSIPDKEPIHNTEPILNAAPVPAVSFNYLGTFDEGGAKGLFRIDDSLPQGRAIAAENIFGSAMAVNCRGTSAGTLEAAFTYDPEVWDEARASALADGFVRELEAVVAHTLAVALPEKTASDFGETAWSDAEFQTAEREFAGRGETLERIYPLMPMQESMLLEALSAPESCTYHVVSRCALDFLPEKDAFERALARLLARHEVLRTAVIYKGVCEPRQAIVSGRALPVTFADFSEARDIAAEAAALERREFEQPIDLQRDPLFRIVFLKTSSSSCQLLFVIHHTVGDGWCRAIYLRDLMKYLREEMNGTAGPDAGAPMKGRYERHVRDIAVRDRSEALACWRTLLDGYEIRAEIPAYDAITDKNRSALNELTFDLPDGSAKRLSALCRAAGCTVNSAVEAAWGLLLQKYNRTDDAVFVKVVSGRDHAAEDVSDVVGLFINSVPVRVRTEKDATLLDLVKSQQRQTGRTSAHDWVPLSEIQRESALGTGLFQSILAFENYETGSADEAGNAGETGNPSGLHMISWHETNVAEIAVAAYADGDRPGSDRLSIDLKFDTGKYTLTAMQRLMDSFRQILCAIAETPDRKACEVPLLDDTETAALIAIGRGPALDYDRSETFMDLFARHVAANPAAMAVVAANGTLTYGELDSKSDELAAKLAGCGVRPGDFVAVKLGRVKEFPLSVIAVWKAGAAYVPVDPEYPEERIAFMLEDSGAKAVIDEAFLGIDEALFGKEAVKMLGSPDPVRVSALPCDPVKPSGLTCDPLIPSNLACTSAKPFKPSRTNLAKPSGLAYMIYTSGSTGKPKGAMVSHASLRAFLAWLTDEFELKAGEAVAEHASFSFDASICDLYTSLSSGATLHILSSELRKDLDGLAKYFTDNKIVGATFSTQFGMELLNACDLKLRYAMLGGEKLRHVKKTSVRIYNGYGPTEFTCLSSIHIVDQENDGENIPIGRAVPNSLSAIVDDSGNLLSRGMVGELVLAGDQLSQGYRNRPELTAEKFVSMPWLAQYACGTGNLAQRTCGANGLAQYTGCANGLAQHTCGVSGLAQHTCGTGDLALRAYRTGDLARWNEDGELIYCGRIDNQVKLRGFRIEMGEIEAAMAKLPGIVSAVAAVKTIGGAQRLCAYYVSDSETDESAAALDESSLKAALSRSLTDYMVPDVFVRLEKLPMTPNGKVDRKALPMPEIRVEEIVAPGAEREKALFEVVAEELKTREFGVTTNLISMGLTSLRAIRLSAAIRKATGLAVPTGEILAKPRIRDWTVLEETEAETIAVLPPRKTYPFTANQLGVYLDWERNRTGLQYNVPSAFRYAGTDAAKLCEAVRKAVAAHPYFKVHLELLDGTPVQVRRDDAPMEIRFTKLDQEPDAAFFQSRVRPFDLLHDDLARFEIYASPEAAYLFFDVHHIIFDGGAANILLKAIKGAFDGAEPAMETVSAYDYALHHAMWQSSEASAKAEAYFDKLVAGAGSFLYPSTRNGAATSGNVAMITTHVPLTAIRAKCRETGVTENAFFATALCETLRRVSRTDDILIETVSNGRALAQLADTVGMFVETLPLVSRRASGSVAETQLPVGSRANDSVAETLRAMQSQIAETVRNDRYPFTKLAERYGFKPNVLYVYQGDVIDSELPSGVTSIPLALDTAKVPLALTVTPGDGNYMLVIEYDTGLYGPEEIASLAEMLKCLSASIAGLNADAPIAEASLVDHQAADELLALGRGVTVDYNHGETFLDLFLPHVQAAPDAQAVVAVNGTLTYGELDAQSSALATALVEAGVRPGDFVAVKLGRVKEFPLAVIAVWKAGAAYVPVDPEYPEARIAYMLEDSGAKVVIDEAFLRSNEAILRKKAVKSLSGPAHAPVKPSGLAYMIYTSGSTGKPKGVMVTHANLRAFLTWRIRMVEAKPGEAFAHYTSFGFDASMDDLATPLAAGAAVHILSESIRMDMAGLRQYLKEHAIAGLTLPTQFGMQLLNDGAPLTLRYLMMGGEKLKATKKSSVRVINGYGPTEFTVCSSYHNVDPENDGENIPVGRPVPNSLSAIVDPSGGLLPRGMVGELVLAGEQLTNGYWNRPELTAEKFVRLPWLEQRAYRTGDLARWNEDGELIYCGRIDSQVKLRGFRIELGEIESAMAKFPGIVSAVAEVKNINGTQHLCAYYVSGTKSDESATETDVLAAGIDESTLKAELAGTLADYMVPDVFMRLEKLPMTPNGKVDRKALPVPDAGEPGGKYIEPVTPEERTLCEAYGRILSLSRYGAETDFFSAGGSSLIGIRLVAELQRLGFNVVYGDIFKYKTPRALAAFLTGSDASLSGSSTSLSGSGASLSGSDASLVSGRRHSTISAGSYDYSSYDYSAIDALLAQTPDEPCEAVAFSTPDTVLLTGATGYLGIHVLKQLLDLTGCGVTLLVRSREDRTMEECVAADYYYYFEQVLSEEAAGRVSFVEGDITDGNLAGKLSDLRFDTVFNCAALVKHYVADDMLDRVNVDGVRNLIKICASHGARLIQISTYSIGGVAAPGTVLDERHLYIGQTSDNDYVRTKFEAERLVLEAIAAGRIRGKVMRLGNLMAQTTDGIFQKNFHSNAFVNSIRTFARLEAFPLANAATPVEFSQIDSVAEAVVRLSMTPDPMVVFHPFNPNKRDLGSVIDAVNAIVRRIDFVPKAEFSARIEAMRSDPAQAKDLQGLLHYGQRGSEQKLPVQASNDWTANVLRRLGFLWKMPAAGYLEEFFRFLDDLRFFD